MKQNISSYDVIKINTETTNFKSSYLPGSQTNSWPIETLKYCNYTSQTCTHDIIVTDFVLP